MRKTLTARSVMLLATSAALAAARSPAGTAIALATPARDLSDPLHPGYIPPIVTKEMLANEAAGITKLKKPAGDLNPVSIKGNDEKFHPLQATSRSPAPV